MTVVFDLHDCEVYDSSKCKINERPEVTASNVGGIYKLDNKSCEVKIERAMTSGTQS